MDFRSAMELKLHLAALQIGLHNLPRAGLGFTLEGKTENCRISS
jgi:hypothetical protein